MFGVAVVVIVAWVVTGSGGPPLPGSEVPATVGDAGSQSTAVMRLDTAADTDRTIRHLASGDPVRLVRGDRELLTIQPLTGPITHENKSYIARRYRELTLVVTAQLLDAVRQGAAQPGMSGLLEEAGLRRTLACHEAIEQALQNDSYIIIRRSDVFPRHLFKDSDVVTNHNIVHEGVPADVVFVLPYADYPNLSATRQGVLDLVRFGNEEESKKFNALDYEVRKRACEASEAARMALMKPPDGLDERRDQATFRSWSDPLEKQLLPQGIWVDKRTFLAYPKK